MRIIAGGTVVNSEGEYKADVLVDGADRLGRP